MLDESRARIQSMALVHEFLYRSDRSLKHAFPAGRTSAPPLIRLGLHHPGDGTCTLIVADNGVGIEGIDPEQGRTLGLRPIRTLTQQIGGTLQFATLSPGHRGARHVQAVTRRPVPAAQCVVVFAGEADPSSSSTSSNSSWRRSGFAR